MADAILYIPEDIKTTLHELCKNRDLEWTLFGKTEPYEDGYRLVDFIVPEQENGGAHTEIEDTAIETLTEELLTKEEDPLNWNVWIHSHNTMGAFFSKTDTDQMDDFGKLGIKMMFSIVVSCAAKEPKMLAWVSLYNPIRTDLEVNIEFEEESVVELEGEAAKEFEEIDKKAEKLQEKLEEISLELLEFHDQKKELLSGFYKELDTEIEAKTIAPKVVSYGKKYNKNYYYDDEDWEYDGGNYRDVDRFDVRKLKKNKESKEFLTIDEMTYVTEDNTARYLDLEDAPEDVKKFAYYLYSTRLNHREIVETIGTLARGNNKAYFQLVRAMVKMNPDRDFLNRFLTFNPFNDALIPA
jgi:hypothetical protein